MFFPFTGVFLASSGLYGVHRLVLHETGFDLNPLHTLDAMWDQVLALGSNYPVFNHTRTPQYPYPSAGGGANGGTYGTASNSSRMPELTESEPAAAPAGKTSATKVEPEDDDDEGVDRKSTKDKPSKGKARMAPYRSWSNGGEGRVAWRADTEIGGSLRPPTGRFGNFFELFPVGAGFLQFFVDPQGENAGRIPDWWAGWNPEKRLFISDTETLANLLFIRTLWGGRFGWRSSGQNKEVLDANFADWVRFGTCALETETYGGFVRAQDAAYGAVGRSGGRTTSGAGRLVVARHSTWFERYYDVVEPPNLHHRPKKNCTSRRFSPSSSPKNYNKNKSFLSTRRDPFQRNPLFPHATWNGEYPDDTGRYPSEYFEYFFHDDAAVHDVTTYQLKTGRGFSPLSPEAESALVDFDLAYAAAYGKLTITAPPAQLLPGLEVPGETEATRAIDMLRLARVLATRWVGRAVGAFAATSSSWSMGSEIGVGPWVKGGETGDRPESAAGDVAAKNLAALRYLHGDCAGQFLCRMDELAEHAVLLEVSADFFRQSLDLEMMPTAAVETLVAEKIGAPYLLPRAEGGNYVGHYGYSGAGLMSPNTRDIVTARSHDRRVPNLEEALADFYTSLSEEKAEQITGLALAVTRKWLRAALTAAAEEARDASIKRIVNSVEHYVRGNGGCYRIPRNPSHGSLFITTQPRARLLCRRTVFAKHYNLPQRNGNALFDVLAMEDAKRAELVKVAVEDSVLVVYYDSEEALQMVERAAEQDAPPGIIVEKGTIAGYTEMQRSGTVQGVLAQGRGHEKEVDVAGGNKVEDASSRKKTKKKKKKSATSSGAGPPSSCSTPADPPVAPSCPSAPPPACGNTNCQDSGRTTSSSSTPKGKGANKKDKDKRPPKKISFKEAPEFLDKHRMSVDLPDKKVEFLCDHAIPPPGATGDAKYLGNCYKTRETYADGSSREYPLPPPPQQQCEGSPAPPPDADLQQCKIAAPQPQEMSCSSQPHHDAAMNQGKKQDFRELDPNSAAASGASVKHVAPDRSYSDNFPQNQQNAAGAGGGGGSSYNNHYDYSQPASTGSSAFISDDHIRNPATMKRRHPSADGAQPSGTPASKSKRWSNRGNGGPHQQGTNNPAGGKGGNKGQGPGANLFSHQLGSGVVMLLVFLAAFLIYYSLHRKNSQYRKGFRGGGTLNKASLMKAMMRKKVVVAPNNSTQNHNHNQNGNKAAPPAPAAPDNPAGGGSLWGSSGSLFHTLFEVNVSPCSVLPRKLTQQGALMKMVAGTKRNAKENEKDHAAGERHKSKRNATGSLRKASGGSRGGTGARNKADRDHKRTNTAARIAIRAAAGSVIKKGSKKNKRKGATKAGLVQPDEDVVDAVFLVDGATEQSELQRGGIGQIQQQGQHHQGLQVGASPTNACDAGSGGAAADADSPAVDRENADLESKRKTRRSNTSKAHKSKMEAKAKASALTKGGAGVLGEGLHQPSKSVGVGGDGLLSSSSAAGGGNAHGKSNQKMNAAAGGARSASRGANHATQEEQELPPCGNRSSEIRALAQQHAESNFTSLKIPALISSRVSAEDTTGTRGGLGEDETLMADEGALLLEGGAGCTRADDVAQKHELCLLGGGFAFRQDRAANVITSNVDHDHGGNTADHYVDNAIPATWHGEILRNREARGAAPSATTTESQQTLRLDTFEDEDELFRDVAEDYHELEEQLQAEGHYSNLSIDSTSAKMKGKRESCQVDEEGEHGHEHGEERKPAPGGGGAGPGIKGHSILHLLERRRSAEEAVAEDEAELFVEEEDRIIGHGHLGDAIAGSAPYNGSGTETGPSLFPSASEPEPQQQYDFDLMLQELPDEDPDPIIAASPEDELQLQHYEHVEVEPDGLERSLDHKREELERTGGAHISPARSTTITTEQEAEAREVEEEDLTPAMIELNAWNTELTAAQSQSGDTPGGGSSSRNNFLGTYKNNFANNFCCSETIGGEDGGEVDAVGARTGGGTGQPGGPTAAAVLNRNSASGGALDAAQSDPRPQAGLIKVNAHATAVTNTCTTTIKKKQQNYTRSTQQAQAQELQQKKGAASSKKKKRQQTKREQNAEVQQALRNKKCWTTIEAAVESGNNEARSRAVQTTTPYSPPTLAKHGSPMLAPAQGKGSYGLRSTATASPPLAPTRGSSVNYGAQPPQQGMNTPYTQEQLPANMVQRQRANIAVGSGTNERPSVMVTLDEQDSEVDTRHRPQRSRSKFGSQSKRLARAARMVAMRDDHDESSRVINIRSGSKESRREALGAALLEETQFLGSSSTFPGSTSWTAGEAGRGRRAECATVETETKKVLAGKAIRPPPGLGLDADDSGILDPSEVGDNQVYNTYAQDADHQGHNPHVKQIASTETTSLASALNPHTTSRSLSARAAVEETAERRQQSDEQNACSAVAALLEQGTNLNGELGSGVVDPADLKRIIFVAKELVARTSHQPGLLQRAISRLAIPSRSSAEMELVTPSRSRSNKPKGGRKRGDPDPSDCSSPKTNPPEKKRGSGGGSGADDRTRIIPPVSYEEEDTADHHESMGAYQNHNHLLHDHPAEAHAPVTGRGNWRRVGPRGGGTTSDYRTIGTSTNAPPYNPRAAALFHRGNEVPTDEWQQRCEQMCDDLLTERQERGLTSKAEKLLNRTSTYRSDGDTDWRTTGRSLVQNVFGGATGSDRDALYPASRAADPDGCSQAAAWELIRQFEVLVPKEARGREQEQGLERLRACLAENDSCSFAADSAAATAAMRSGRRVLLVLLLFFGATQQGCWDIGGDRTSRKLEHRTRIRFGGRLRGRGGQHTSKK
eukprot:g11979.t1